MDFSTLNQTALAQLPIAVIAPGNRLDANMGSGGFLDAQGYPSFFLQAVYTGRGNTPARGPATVIQGRVIEDGKDAYVEGGLRKKLHALWSPLPFDHPRVEAWQRHAYTHMRHCYVDDAGIAEKPEYGRPATIIFPVPYYKLASFHDDPRFSEEWRTQEKAAVETRNAELHRLYAQVAIPENHAAFRMVRKFYPEAPPRLDLISDPGHAGGNWYETEATQPTPETCNPRLPASWGKGSQHPVNGTWCQWCGWHAEKSEAA